MSFWRVSSFSISFHAAHCCLNCLRQVQASGPRWHRISASAPADFAGSVLWPERTFGATSLQPLVEARARGLAFGEQVGGT